MVCDTYTQRPQTPLRNFSGQIFRKWRSTLVRNAPPARISGAASTQASHWGGGGLFLHDARVSGRAASLPAVAAAELPCPYPWWWSRFYGVK